MIFQKKEGVSLAFTVWDLNPKAAADGQSTFCFKWPFLHLMILTIVFHTFLKLITANKMYILKNESIFSLIRMCTFGGSTGLYGCCGKWVSYTISGREKKCIQKFISLRSAVWDQRQHGYKEKTYRLRYEGTGTGIELWCIFIRRQRHFCSEWQQHWEWDRWHYLHKLHTVDRQYKLNLLSP